MWWSDEQLARGLRSRDAGVRRMTLSLLRAHREVLDGFVTRHAAFFFGVVSDLIQRFDEPFEVRRKAWSVLTALVRLHSKTHTGLLLYEFHVFNLALETLGGVYGRDQGACCVNEALEFLLALKQCNGHNLSLFELDAQVVPCLTALPVRLGQGIDRFGYKLLTQLLRELQVSEGEECAEAVDQHACELVDLAGSTMFLILTERIVEECRPSFVSRDSGSCEVIPHSNACWPGLSPWQLGALLAEAAQVLQTINHRVVDAPPLSFDKAIALKWLHANSAAITEAFQKAHNLIAVLTFSSSDGTNTSVVQRLAAELVDVIAIQPTLTTTDEAATDPEVGARYQLSVATLEWLLKLHNGRSDEQQRVVQSFMSSSEDTTLADQDREALSGMLADRGTPTDLTEEHKWELLAATITEPPEGTSVTCPQARYKLVSAALQVLVDAEQSKAPTCTTWAQKLLMGPLLGICLDELDRNSHSWRFKSPHAAVAITTLLIQQLDCAEDLKPGDKSRIWRLLSKWLESTDREAVIKLVNQYALLTTVARDVTIDPSCVEFVAVLQCVLVLIRMRVLLATLCDDWIQIALKAAIFNLKDSCSPSIEFLKTSVGIYPECLRAIEKSVSNLVQDAAERELTVLEFVERVLSTPGQSLIQSTPRMVYLLANGNALEKLVVLRYFESLSTPACQEFISYHSGLTVLQSALSEVQTSHKALARRIVAKVAQTTDPQLFTSGAVTSIGSRVPAELDQLCRELEGALTGAAEIREILSQRAPELVQLGRREGSAYTFLRYMQTLFSPAVVSAILSPSEQLYSPTECKLLDQLALRTLELDGKFEYRNQVFRLLRTIYSQGDRQQAPLVDAIPLLVQCLSEEDNPQAANSLTDLLRDFAPHSHEMSARIDECVQTLVEEDSSSSVFYQNLLAVYRKSDGMELGKHNGTVKIPNLVATIDVLLNGHSLERIIALKHLRNHIPLLQPTTVIPVDFVEAMPTIFGLTLSGPPANRAVAKQVLMLLSARDSRCATVASQFSFPSAGAGLSLPMSTDVKNKAGDEESQHDTEPEDEHAMYDTGDDLTYMYSDSDDEDETMEGYEDCEDSDNNNGVTTTTTNSHERHCPAQRSVSSSQ